MAFDSLECTAGGKVADAVPEQRVSRVSGVVAEDVTLIELPDKALTVGEDRACEVKGGENLQASGDGKCIIRTIIKYSSSQKKNILERRQPRIYSLFFLQYRI